MTKEITLTQGKVALVDDEDFEWISQWKWCIRGRYAVRRCGKSGQITRMHRQILATQGINLEGLEVDHINGNGLDNRRANLRACTRTQNAANRGAKIGSASGYKGIYRCEEKGGWIAEVMGQGRRVRRGAFPCLYQAVIAYNELASELHGDFAYLYEIPIEIEFLIRQLPERPKGRSFTAQQRAVIDRVQQKIAAIEARLAPRPALSLLERAEQITPTVVEKAA